MDVFREWLPVMIAFGALVGTWVGIARLVRKDTQEDAMSGAELRTKLTHIGEDVKDVQVELQGLYNNMSSLVERLTRVEESAKQAHKRIDTVSSRLDAGQYMERR